MYDYNRISVAQPKVQDITPTEPEWKKGFASFADEMQALGGGAVALAGQATGMEGVRDWGLDVYERNMEESTAGWQAPNVAKIEDIKPFETGGMDRLGDWAAYHGTKGLANVASLALSGGIGGAIAKGATKRAVKEIAKSQVGKNLAGRTVTAGIKKGAVDDVRRNVTRGVAAGGFVGAFGMEGGGAFGQQVGGGVAPEDALLPSLGVGAVNAALELVAPYQIAKKLGLVGKAREGIAAVIPKDKVLEDKAIELAKKAIKLSGKVVKGGASSAATEGLTEGIQELVQLAGERWAKDEELLADLSPEDRSQIMNAAAAGALVGGGVGGATGPFVQEPTRAPEVQPPKTMAEPSPEIGPVPSPETGMAPTVIPGITPTQEGTDEAAKAAAAQAGQEAGTPEAGPKVGPKVGPEGTTPETPSARDKWRALLAARLTPEQQQDYAAINTKVVTEPLTPEEQKRYWDYKRTLGEAEQEAQTGTEASATESSSARDEQGAPPLRWVDFLAGKGININDVDSRTPEYKTLKAEYDALVAQGGVSSETKATSDWTDNVFGNLAKIAENNGTADRIADLAAQYKTAGQIARELGIDKGMVQAVRSARNIPSYTDQVGVLGGAGAPDGPEQINPEFTRWRDEWLAQNKTEQPTQPTQQKSTTTEAPKEDINYAKWKAQQNLEGEVTPEQDAGLRQQYEGIVAARPTKDPRPAVETITKADGTAYKTRAQAQAAIARMNKKKDPRITKRGGALRDVVTRETDEGWVIDRLESTTSGKADKVVPRTVQEVETALTGELGQGWITRAKKAGMLNILDEAGPNGRQADYNQETGEITIYAKSLGEGPIAAVALHEGSHATMDELLGGRLGEAAREVFNRGAQEARAGQETNAATAARKAEQVHYRWKAMQLQRQNPEGTFLKDYDALAETGKSGAAKSLVNNAWSKLDQEVRTPLDERANEILDEEAVAYYVEGSAGKADGLLRRIVNRIKAEWLASAPGQTFAKMRLAPKIDDGTAVALARKATKYAVDLREEMDRRGAPSAEGRGNVLESTPDTPAFKNWFKDSKVVDEQGEPLRVYHGTKRDFSSFKPRFGDGLSFFTVNPEFASSWPEGSGGIRANSPENEAEYERLYKRQNEISNELFGTMEEYNKRSDAENAKILEQAYAQFEKETGFRSPFEYESKAGVQVMPVYLSIQKPFDPRVDWPEMEDFIRENVSADLVKQGAHKAGNWLVYESQAVIDELKRKGYDGIWLAENIDGPHETIAPFSSEQIKSAVGNQGTYDDSANILESKVWHAGPNEWLPEPGYPYGRPRLDKVGTGEGGQLFGWGWYSAENEKVSGPEGEYAKSFSTPPDEESLGTKVVMSDGRSLQAFLNGHTNPDASIIILEGLDSVDPSKVKTVRDFERALAYESNRLKENIERDDAYSRKYAQEEYDTFTQLANDVQTNVGTVSTSAGKPASVYRLEIPDEDIDRMIQWEKPLSEQTGEVKKMLRKSEYVLPADLEGKLNTAESGFGAVEFAPVTAKELYERLTKKLPSAPDEHPKKKVSNYLQSLGIVGNKYLDFGSRGEPKTTLVDKQGNEVPVESLGPYAYSIIDALEKHDGKINKVRLQFQEQLDVAGQEVRDATSSWDREEAEYKMESANSILDTLRDFKRQGYEIKTQGPTYNYVVWDQSVLDDVAHLNQETGIRKFTERHAAELDEIAKKADAPASSLERMSGVLESLGSFDKNWVSTLGTVVEGAKQNKMQPSQWLGWLKKQPGVKAEEIEDTGLEDWLDAQPVGVSKEAVKDFLDRGGVKVEEIEVTETQYADYQLPGGENYRELLIKVPTETRQEKFSVQAPRNPQGTVAERQWQILDAQGELVETASTVGIAETIAAELSKEQRVGPEAYNSTHWDEPNVLVHVRFNERTDTNGDRVLFVEEVQSDWHQEGRKEGYQGEKSNQAKARIAELQANHDEILTKLAKEFPITAELVGRVPQDTAVVLDRWAGNRDMLPSTKTGKPPTEDQIAAVKAASNMIRAIYDEQKQWQSERVGVPDAPFKSSWPMLGMKRAIKWAAENGFDKVAWTPGEMQADRYDLSKQISQILYRKESNSVYISAFPLDTMDTPIEQTVPLSGLDNVVGKEIAEKIQNNEGTLARDGLTRSLSKLDLKLGGEGMKGFYDKILPSAMNKFGKKYGAKVGATEVETDAGMNEVWSFPITPKLAAQAEQGMILYSMPGSVSEAWALGREYFVGNEGRFWERSRASKVQGWLQDRFNELKRYQTGLQKKGKKLGEGELAYEAETASHGRKTKRTQLFRQKYVDPMLKLLANNGLTIENVNEAVYANHAREANKRGRLINAKHYWDELLKDVSDNKKLTKEMKQKKDNLFERDSSEAGRQQGLYVLLKEYAKNYGSEEFNSKWEEFDLQPSGMSDKEATELMETGPNAWGKNPVMPQVLDMFDEMNRQVPLWFHQENMMNAERFSQWSNAYKHYATLQREGFENTLTGGGQGYASGKPSALRKFSPRRAIDPFTNSIAKAESAIRKVENNKIGLALAELAKNHPDPNFMTLKTHDEVPYLDANGFIDYGATKATSNLDTIYWEKGVPKVISAMPQNQKAASIIAAMNNLETPTLGPVMRTMGKAVRFMAAMNTTWSPEFFFTNMPRDFFTAQYNMGDTEAGDLRKKINSYYIPSAKALRNVWRAQSKGLPVNEADEWVQWAKRFEESGGRTGWMDLYENTEAREKQLQKRMAEIGDAKSYHKTAHNIASFVEDYNAVAENAMRLAAFKALVESGVKQTRAVSIVKDLTTNFNRRGTAGPAINTLYMFAGAGIQGSARILSALKHPKVRKYVYGTIGMSFIVDQLNRAFDDDDEYDNIPDYVKERNLIFKNPLGGGYVTIPAPWGYNTVWSIGQKMSEGLSHTQGDLPNWSPMKAGQELASTALSAFMPVQGGTVLQTLAPTIFDPIAQIAENKDPFGRALKPEPYPNQQIPLSEQYWKSASSFSQDAAKAANWATGGDEVVGGWGSFSPAWLDAIGNQVFGSVGRQIVDVGWDFPKSVWEDDTELRDIPVARKLYAFGGKSRDAALYHERIAQIEQVKQILNAYEKGPRADVRVAREFRRENAAIYRMVPMATDFEKQRRALQKQLSTAKSLDRDSRVEALQKKIEDLRERFNRSYQNRVGN